MPKTLVDITNALLADLGFSPLHSQKRISVEQETGEVEEKMNDKQLKQELTTHAQTVLAKWADGKVIHKDSRLTTEEDHLKHEMERDLIHTASFNKKELPSVYTVMDDGRIEMDHPLHAPAWAKARDLGEAKTFERYSKVARRLQKKLLAKGVVKQEDLHDLRRFT